ncbi:MAG: TetR/AcrR family transcriptional regulator, partial [Rhizobiales bacterium]|nr:TetR/AcrR family transcriptional regulator [Hyphomicrobiales bacterium]
MPRQKSYDRTDVLTRAMLAFWARGYEATSMAELV